MTQWYLQETVKPTAKRPFANVCYFVKERRYMEYAIKRVPNRSLLTHPNVYLNINCWGQRIAIDFLGRLYDLWIEEMMLSARTSPEEKYGFFPKLFLGDISQRGGGPMLISGGKTAHITHQHGTQIDIYYCTTDGKNRIVICDDNKPDAVTGWSSDLNARLLRTIFKASQNRVGYVLTCSHKILNSSEFKPFVAKGRLRYKDFHWDHYHIDLI